MSDQTSGLTSEELAEIEARAARDVSSYDPAYTTTWAGRDRKVLLAEVKRLNATLVEIKKSAHHTSTALDQMSAVLERHHDDT